jgi:chaperone required for assembly of F1-ATPase
MEQNQNKRFYSDVTIITDDEGYGISLDGKILRTPASTALSAASLPLIKAITLEWESQKEHINFKSMPLFRLLATAIDRVAPNRDEVNKITLQFGITDLLFYRAKEPPELKNRQEDMWQPMVDWAEESMGIKIHITEGILPVSQPKETVNAMELKLKDFTDLELTAVSSVAANTGSLVIGLALESGIISGNLARSISLIEEIYQMEKWGEDQMIKDRHKKIDQDISECCELLRLIQ